jgi:hypothetical protein
MLQKQTPTEFTESLVKGRIAEIIFERMLLATDKYTVLKGGYEHSCL